MARTILAEHRTRPIREAVEGETVKVVGVVRALDETLRSPITGRPCVYFDATIRKKVPPKKRANAAMAERTIVRDREAVEFVVEDEGGRALVKTGDMQVVLVRDIDEKMRAGSKPEVEALLALHGYDLGYEAVVVKEGALVPGERVAVVGRARWAPDEREHVVSYRDRRHLLLLDAPDAHPLIVSDDPETFG